MSRIKPHNALQYINRETNLQANNDPTDLKTLDIYYPLKELFAL